MVSEIALIIGAAVILIGLLLVRFVIKTAITLAKVGLIVGIAVAAWLGLQLILEGGFT